MEESLSGHGDFSARLHAGEAQLCFRRMGSSKGHAMHDFSGLQCWVAHRYHRVLCLLLWSLWVSCAAQSVNVVCSCASLVVTLG